MRTAFAAYARDHEAASIRRCWSTWNVLCTFLYTGEVLAANPMQLVGRPKLAKPLPKALPRTAVEALLETAAQDHAFQRQIDWAERDLAIVLTALLAGLRAEELRQADVGDIRTTDDGAAVIHVKGKGGKDRSVPIEAELLSVIEAYLDSRAIRFPGDTKRKADGVGSALSRWAGRSPLFVGHDGERITRGTLQSRIKRAFKRAGPEAQPVPGAMVLSRSGARCRCCHGPVSPDRSPHPACVSPRTGRSTVPVVRRGWGSARGWESCCPGSCNGKPSPSRSGRTRFRPPRFATARWRRSDGGGAVPNSSGGGPAACGRVSRM